MPSDVPRWKSGRGYSGRGGVCIIPSHVFPFLAFSIFGFQHSLKEDSDVHQNPSDRQLITDD